MRTLSITLIVLVSVLVVLLMGYAMWSMMPAKTMMSTAAPASTSIHIGTDGVSVKSGDTSIATPALAMSSPVVTTPSMPTMAQVTAPISAAVAAPMAAVSSAVAAPLAAVNAAVNAASDAVTSATAAVTPLEAKAGGAGGFNAYQHYQSPHILPYRWF